MELVRDILLEKLLMEIAVDLVEEVRSSAVEDDVQGIRSQKMSHIDDSVLIPVLRMFFDGAQTLRNVPFVRERTEIDSS